jgi:hypothetical protein
MEESAIFWMVVSILLTFSYVPLIYSHFQLLLKNKELKNKVESLQKKAEAEAATQRLKNALLITKHENITKKYNFMRWNTRKFNLRDKVGVYTIVDVDVKIPGIVDHLIGAGKIFINWLTRTKMKPETDPHFVYECSDGNPINTRFTENQLVTIAKESKKAPKKSKTKTN